MENTVTAVNILATAQMENNVTMCLENVLKDVPLSVQVSLERTVSGSLCCVLFQICSPLVSLKKYATQIT